MGLLGSTVCPLCGWEDSVQYRVINVTSKQSVKDGCGALSWDLDPCRRLVSTGSSSSATGEADGNDPPLRKCQRDCLEACAQGARVIEMACGTGKTRVIKEIVRNSSGRAPWVEI